MACPETRVTRGGMLRVFGWYDNEWGFSNRMLDVALRMGVNCPAVGQEAGREKGVVELLPILWTVFGVSLACLMLGACPA
jgi:hypothetical protein